MPDLVTSSWWKEERGERVFVDFNQANRDRTIAAAYSPRPLPGAPVSMPLRWEDLDGADPRHFTVHTVPAIVAEQGCAWADIDDEPGVAREGREQQRVRERERRDGRLPGQVLGPGLHTADHFHGSSSSTCSPRAAGRRARRGRRPRSTQLTPLRRPGWSRGGRRRR